MGGLLTEGCSRGSLGLHELSVNVYRTSENTVGSGEHSEFFDFVSSIQV